VEHADGEGYFIGCGYFQEFDVERIETTLIPRLAWDTYGENTSEGDDDDHLAGRFGPNHRSARLGHNI
jgi:hypothetical protein